MSSQRERFSEQEVGLILQRAAELQGGHGTSLEELENAAVEAGIDRALVRRAAQEVRNVTPAPLAPSGERTGIFGPLELVQERALTERVDGRAAIGEIRRQLGIKGKAELEGRDLVWSANGELGARRLRVSVTGRRDRTMVRVDEATTPLAIALYTSIMPSTFVVGVAWIVPVCLAALGQPLLIAVLLPLWVIACFTLCRFIYGEALKGRRSQLARLAAGIEDALHDGEANSSDLS